MVCHLNSNHIILSWQVAQQINNDKFIIEHSQDGKSFIEIGETKGEGNYVTKKDYEYQHKSPSIGANYYRIKQVDKDGKYEFSNVDYVEYQPTEKKQITIYPNPFDQKLNITSSFKTKMSVYNHFGSLIKQIELKEGNNDIDMSGYLEGLYIFRTENGEVERVVKL